jgi:hypothetical protein
LESSAAIQVPGLAERRLARRYPISLELKYYLVRRGQVVDRGAGHTVDISTGGILIENRRPLPRGVGIHVFVAWPAPDQTGERLELEIYGRIVRTEGNRTAIHMTRHQFLAACALHRPLKIVSAQTAAPGRQSP